MLSSSRAIGFAQTQYDVVDGDSEKEDLFVCKDSKKIAEFCQMLNAEYPKLLKGIRFK